MAARSKSWRNLRQNSPATATGLALLGFHQTGALSIVYGVPLLALVALNFALWLTARTRRGRASQIASSRSH